MSSQQRTFSFRLMTYNIRLDTMKDGINQWYHRKNRVINLIQHYSPDLLGVQEPLPQQMTDLQTGLSNYGSYGVGRNDGRDSGEFCGIFYRHDRFELNDKGTFWLSETPDMPGSKGWDAALPRICSWVKLKDRLANKEIYYFNTHFDHEGRIARRQSAHLILTRIEQMTGTSTPTILTGDFNSGPESDAYLTIITNINFQDAKLLTESPHSGPDGTWCTFDVKHGIGDRIDYIFITSPHFKVLQHAHLTDSENKLYPSDHLPVLAELDYKN
ncbi:unnamed protein product [Rotaria sp. Silwood2]|nr:unnamed protein product [Rotaria sp. Silwood2]CAF2667646.1 unnamed protein product [Rotaria sp. Silwood2]CAF3963999.1 unnamed protein product [Rotaria sp. Silwood2]CAF4062821.1 unnamed protein product [Rotaria sp. Silwood2]